MAPMLVLRTALRSRVQHYTMWRFSRHVKHGKRICVHQLVHRVLQLVELKPANGVLQTRICNNGAKLKHNALGKRLEQTSHTLPVETPRGTPLRLPSYRDPQGDHRRGKQPTAVSTSRGGQTPSRSCAILFGFVNPTMTQKRKHDPQSFVISDFA